MTKIKKVSITAFDRVLKERYTPIDTIDWYGVKLSIKKTLSLKEMLEFVDIVTQSCFTTDENHYLPEIKDFAIRCCILEKYGNFSLPVNTEHKYELVYCTDAVQTVMTCINKEQFHTILDAINDKIDNLAQANIEAINKQMNEVYAAFSNIEEQLGGMFSNFGTDEAMNILKTLGDGNFDEKKLVEAYMDRAKNTDGE